jgi:RNA polymerase sigma-70 factor (ECF subfamily)
MSDRTEQPERHTDVGADARGVSVKANVASRADESALIEGLRRGDEDAFLALMSMYYPAMLRLARLYVGDRAAAEDVIQETWVGVLRGIAQFEGRSALKTWLFHILINRAKTRAQRDGRTIPFSSLGDAAADADEPSVDPDRFRPDADEWPGHWSSAPGNWEDLPEERMLSQETRARIEQAIQALAPAQRDVITLRDVEGWSAAEVCDFLNVTEANQRVLLHRARSKVRAALEKYFTEE